MMLAAIFLCGLCGLIDAVKPSVNDVLELPDLLEIAKTEVVCDELKARGYPIVVKKKPTGGKIGFSHDRWLMVCSCKGNADVVVLWAHSKADLVLTAGKPRATKGSAFVHPPLPESESKSLTLPITHGQPGALVPSTLSLEFQDVESAKRVMLQINFPQGTAEVRLKFCLESPTCFPLFEDYSTKELSMDNLLFIKYADTWMDKLGREEIKYIWDTFINAGGELEINIPGPDRTALTAAFLDGHGEVKAAFSVVELAAAKSALAETRQGIFTLVASDTFMRFVKSDKSPVLF